MRETQLAIMRLEYSKFGILPEKFATEEVKFSYSDAKFADFVKNQEEKLHTIIDHDEDYMQSDYSDDPLDQFDIWSLIILNNGSVFCLFWNFFEVLCCIISSYMYAYMAAFGINNNDLTINVDLRIADIFFFVVFTVSIIMNFLRDFVPEGETQACKDLKKIANRYLHGQFSLDFIAWVPFQFIIDFNQHRLLNCLYAIKIIRLRSGLQYFNIFYLMGHVKRGMKYYSEYKIAKQPTLADSKDTDQNGIY